MLVLPARSCLYEEQNKQHFLHTTPQQQQHHTNHAPQRSCARSMHSFAHHIILHSMALHLHHAAPLGAACQQQRGSSMPPAAAAAVPAAQQPALRALPVQQPAMHHACRCPPTLQGTSGRSAVRCRVVSPEQPAASAADAAAQQPPAVAAAAAGAAATLSVTQSLGSIDEVATCVPEDFELPLGVLSPVDRTSPSAPEDAYMCPGCTRPECQVWVFDCGWQTRTAHSMVVMQRRDIVHAGPAEGNNRPGLCMPCCTSVCLL